MNKRWGIFALATAMLFQAGQAATYNAATPDEVLAAIPKCVGGDQIILTATTYTFSSSQKIVIQNSGSAGNRIYMGPSGNGMVKFDFSAQAMDNNNQGVKVNGNWWHIKGIEITGAGDNGMLVEDSTIITSGKWNDNKSSGCYNKIEKCVFSSNRDAGLQFKNGASYDTIINCDSYYSFDTPDGGDADGFAPKQNCGPGLYFYGCRAWNNSDDGWDAFFKSDKPQASSRVTIVTDYCVAFLNGTTKDGSQPSGSNGNGFKMGSKEYACDFLSQHCLAVANHGAKGSKGFDANNNTGTMTMLNCSAYDNFAKEFAFKSGSSVIKNCNAIGGASDIDINSTATSSDWTATTSDFISTNIEDLKAPRNSDGSLPQKTLNFMCPKSGDTKFINKGSNVGLPISGGQADIGWIEVGLSITDVKDMDVSRPKNSAGQLVTAVSTLKNGAVQFDLTCLPSGKLDVAVYNLTGKKVMTINNTFDAGNKKQIVDMSKLAAGAYMFDLSFTSLNGTKTDNIKIIK